MVCCLSQTIDFLFALDIVFSFLRAYRDVNGLMISEPSKIYHRYLSGGFISDTFIALPMSLMAYNSHPEIRAWVRLPKVMHSHGFMKRPCKPQD